MSSIAIFGLNGLLGQPLLDALTSATFADKVAFPIKAVTRKDLESTDKVQYIKAELDDTAGVAAALKGVDVVVELVGPNPEVFGKIEKIVEQVKPKLIIPTQFGLEIAAVQSFAPGLLTLKANHSNHFRKTGAKVIDVITALFADRKTFSYERVAHYGIDIEKNTLDKIGADDSKVAISTLPDIGRVIASIVTDSDPSRFPDTTKVFSEVITQKQVWDTYEKNHNVKLEVTSTKTPEQARKELSETWKTEGFNPAKFSYYLNVTHSQGIDQGLLFSEDQRELVNPGEKLWKWGHF